jgi:hypothetical protein
MSHNQNTGQDHTIRMTNKYFQNVEKLNYVGMAVINKNYTVFRINSRNTFYYLIQYVGFEVLTAVD